MSDKFFVFNDGNKRFNNMEMGRGLKVENTKVSLLISVKDNGFELIFGFYFKQKGRLNGISDIASRHKFYCFNCFNCFLI